MITKRIVFCLGGSVLAGAAVVGCQHADAPRTVYEPAPKRVYVMQPSSGSPSGNASGGVAQASPQNSAPAPSVTELPAPAEFVRQAPPQESPVALATPTPPPLPAPPALAKEEEPANPGNAVETPVEVAAAPKPPPPAEQPMAASEEPSVQVVSHRIPEDRPAARRSFVDTTANPCFSHSEDYRTLVGQLQRSHLSKSWRLRYASVDEADPYGGSVTLVEDDRLNNLKDGQFVRIVGRFLNPDEKRIAPAYQIDSLQPLGDGK